MASQQGKITILHSIFMTSKAERHYKTFRVIPLQKLVCFIVVLHRHIIALFARVPYNIRTHCDGANLKAVARSNVSCKLTGWTQATKEGKKDMVWGKEFAWWLANS